MASSESPNPVAKGPGPLLSLAPEVVSNIITQVSSRRDLSALRLSCKSLDEHAKQSLFRDVFLSPLDDHVSTFTSISQDDVLRKIPRHAIIHSQSDIDEDSSRNADDAEDITEEFEAAVAALSQFPNLDSVEIGFTPECLGERDGSWWEDVMEDVPRRKEILTMIFDALHARAQDEGNRKIRKLTITNLQNCPIPSITSSDSFRAVMADLSELHICMTQEYNEHGPDHDYTRVELQTFPKHLASAWLAPIAANLRSLSLYSRCDKWGPFPGSFPAAVKAAGLAFPNLENLALGYYTLAHDDDLDWVLSIKSLKRLVLHNAMIASWIRILDLNMSEWGVSTHDWTAFADEPEGESYSYSGTWSTFLDRIAAELPELREFAFDQPDTWRGGLVSERHLTVEYGMENRDRCGCRIDEKRYVVFDNGILPTHWCEAEGDGELHCWRDHLDGWENGWQRNVHQENLEKDTESLGSLMEVVGKRR